MQIVAQMQLQSQSQKSFQTPKFLEVEFSWSHPIF
jgi:hypothetical protein